MLAGVLDVCCIQARLSLLSRWQGCSAYAVSMHSTYVCYIHVCRYQIARCT
ncbi:unnamed protein product, partial [Laminaria digitata]